MSPLQHMQGIAAAGLAALAMLPSTGASAGNLNFGPETVVRRLADVRLQNGTGEPLYLGQKLTFHWFGLPYAVSTGGYALGVRGKHDHYDIEKDRLIEWQGEGYVPNPLPEYRLTLADYALGYLAWLVGALLALVYAGRAVLGRRLARRTPAKAADAPAATATPAPVEPASLPTPTPSPSPSPASTPFTSPAPSPAPAGPRLPSAALVAERRAPSNSSPAVSAPRPREVTIVQAGPVIKTVPPAAAAVPVAPRAAPEVPAKRPEPKRVEPAAVPLAPVPPAPVTKVLPQPRPIEPQPAAKVRYRVKAGSA